MTRTKRSAAAVAYPRICEAVGAEIVTGALSPGHVMTLEDLSARFGASRTVLREAMRVLESLGLIESRRRVGLVVQPPEHWNVFDTRVIRWRLDSDQRTDQLRSLTQLRIGIEPLAAHFAALNATPEQRTRLVALGGHLRCEGEARLSHAFLASDQEFHSLILLASGNEMFAALQTSVQAVLRGRTEHGLMPSRPRKQALDLHEEVARAIAAGEPRAAEAAMAALLNEARAALDSDFPAATDEDEANGKSTPTGRAHT